MFSIRLMGRKGEAPPSDRVLAFGGIRNTEKLKSFLMTDIITYHVYSQLSEGYFAQKKQDDDRKLLTDIQKVSRTLALNFAGNPSGTPADQISKRVDNMVSLIRGEPQRNKDSAVTVEPGNLDIYRAVFDRMGTGVQIAVSVRMPDSGCVKEISESNGYVSCQNHVALGDMMRWISSGILEASRSEPALQTVMKIQYDLIQKVFQDRGDIQEPIRYGIVRSFLALSCILNGEMSSIGDVYCPCVDYGSFSVLLPRFIRPEVTDNLVIVSAPGLDPSPCDALDSLGIFANRCVCSDPVHRWDMELMLYDARLRMGYRPYNLIVMDDRRDADWMDMLMECLQTMRWIPEHMTFVTDGSAVKTPVPHSVMVMSDPSRLSEDLCSLYTVGISSNDRYAEAVLRTTYRDILGLGYPGIRSVVSGIEPRSDTMRLFDAMREHVRNSRMDPDAPFTELVRYLAGTLDSVKE